MIRHEIARALPLAVLVFWAPLPFASVAPFFASLLVTAGLAVAAAALLTARDRTEPGDPGSAAARTPASVPSPTIVPVVALAAIALLGGLQSFAWPAPVARGVAPAIARAFERSRELVPDLPAARGVALSLAPATSRFVAWVWLLAAATLLAALLVGRGRRARRALLVALLGAAAIQIAIGVEAWISRSTTLWGVELPGFAGRLHGSFVNPNHLALFLEIALAVAAAWLWWSARSAFLHHQRAESRLIAIGPAAVTFLFLFAGLALTGSRAGVIAAAGALGFQGWLVGRARGRRWILAGGLLVALAGVAFVQVVGVEGSLQRFVAVPLDDAGGNSRAQAAAATLALWLEVPLTGVGLGAFEAAFPRVQPANLPGVWRHAHSDWVELLATTGLVGFAILLAGLFFYGRALRRVVRRGERSEDRAAGLAAAGALVACGLHSFVDFGLTMPANAVALAVVAGCGAAARTRRSEAAA